MSSKWSYLSQTTPCIGQYLEKLDNILQCHLIPNLTGRPPPNETERDLLGRLGGLGIIIPSQQSDQEFKSSMLVTAPLRELIHSQDHAYALTNLISAKAEIPKRRFECQSPQRGANTYSQESHESSKGNGLFKLIDDVASGGAWRVCSRSGPEIWMVSAKHCYKLCLWCKFHYRTCSLLPKRWIPVNTPQ